MQTLNCLEDKI